MIRKNTRKVALGLCCGAKDTIEVRTQSKSQQRTSLCKLRGVGQMREHELQRQDVHQPDAEIRSKEEENATNVPLKLVEDFIKQWKINKP